MIKTYQELSQIDGFLERYDYLRLGGMVGESTFGFDRHFNQAFYRSSEWRRVRDSVIIRDNGCDLGVLGHEIRSDLLVHHINPLTVDDILGREEWILNPNFLITTTQATHNAIHYGNRNLLAEPFVARVPGDTKLW